MSILEQNTAEIYGKVVSSPIFSHAVYGEDFYLFDLEVSRLSDTNDIIPVLVSEKIMRNVVVGSFVHINGQIRTYNKMNNSSRKLLIYIFPIDIATITEEDINKLTTPNNMIVLKGFLCKNPIYRTTPFGREITDLLIAVNRAYHKSDYIPCVTWGRNAKYAKDFKVGQEVEVTARFQSREYNKKDADGEITKKLAYELSILNIKAL